MGIANLANIPSTPEEVAEFAFSHMAHHRDINRTIFEANGLVLPEYPLDPMDVENLTTFGYQHQIMHNAQNAVLNIAGNDLTDVNWRDPGERTTWIWLNFNEHLQANAILGV